MPFLALFTNLAFYHLSLSVVQYPLPSLSQGKYNRANLSHSLSFILGAQVYRTYSSKLLFLTCHYSCTTYPGSKKCLCPPQTNLTPPPPPPTLNSTADPTLRTESFLANITASAALTRAQFRILQAAIWPMYFKLQMITSLLLALTYPGGAITETSNLFPGSASLKGLLDGGEHLTVLLPLTLMFVFPAINVLVLAPKTIGLMWKLQIGMFCLTR